VVEGKQNMKAVKQHEEQFIPIIITLESEEEARALKTILNFSSRIWKDSTTLTKLGLQTEPTSYKLHDLLCYLGIESYEICE
jgi:hypothetical protein